VITVAAIQDRCDHSRKYARPDIYSAGNTRQV
jgi:hypothetical protein